MIVLDTNVVSGILRLPNGVRRQKLVLAVEAIIDQEFRDRILVFDADAAVEYASLVVEREAAGRPISMADAQIAAVCRVHNCVLATRNLGDFDKTGVTIVDPWTDETPPHPSG